uniref:Proline rich 12a n=1 Tax=Neogobius melanostomus TaxID=47308 RepID=A0A8C6ULL7_9GOBI
MDRNYPGTGFGDLGAGAGWSYERSAKASLVYGSSRSSHPESELLHRQAYATPHPLQGYATNHHPGSLSGLFDTGLHHASPSAPDASVMNLISALESRGPQPPPSASSLLSQFRTPSWQTAMHTPAPPELFISGALPGSGSFPSSSALSAYQHPASFSSRSFPAASLSLQDTPTFSPTSNGLLSPHDPLLHIKAPSQSSLGFDRLLSSQGAAAAAYRGSQDPTGATSAQASSARHLQSHQFNLLSSQLQDQSSQLYNASVFSSAQPQSQSQSQSNSAQERAVPRQDSVIKHYQRPTPSQSQLSSSAAHSLQHYLSCGGAGYQQIATHHRHAGLSCSPLGDQSPSSDHKSSSRTEYRPIIQPAYSSSSSSSSSSDRPRHNRLSLTPPVNPHVTLSSVLWRLQFSAGPRPEFRYRREGLWQSGGRSQSYSADLYGTDSAYGSLPSSLGGAGSPSIGYGATGHSPALLRSSGGTGSGSGSYHIPDSSPSPSGNSSIIRPGLHSPVPTCPSQSPGGPGSNKYISSVLSPTFLSSPQGYPDTRGPSSQSQPYHTTTPSSKTKSDTSMLGVGTQRSQEEVDDDEEFLIQHLLQAQASPTPQSAHHHAQQQQQTTSQQSQPQPQSGPSTTDSSKGLSYDMSKSSEERYHPQSVIRTHSATSSGGVGNAGSGASISGLDTQLEMSLKKHSVVHYGRGDPYSQHSLAPQHTSHNQHVSSHSQLPHAQMDLQKKSQERAEIPYPRKTPEVQPQHSQSQGSLLDSPTDQSRQPPHLLQSVLSHTTRNKLEPHQQHHKMDSHRQHPQHHKMDTHQSHQQHAKMDSHSQHQPHTKMEPHQHQHHKMDSHSQQQQHSISQQQAVLESLTPQQGQLDQQRSEQHQFDTVSPVEKADQNQQSNRFVPLTSICFPDSLLQDEDRSFFPGMEDMFCAEDYKSSCTGGAGPGYDMMGHHGNQGYEPYCHGLEEPSNNTMTLDLDSLKTHELPSTVNTEQLGLIQSQPQPWVWDLISPIFCSSRPKKLLKSSSFHLLKERRDPNTLPKKSYAQEYEFEDDEDKADQPADIRLNSRRLPDLLPDLVSSCRKAGAGGSLSPLMGDIDFYHSSGYSSIGSHSLMPQEGPKKRGRKPTRPKREGPPRPRGRPRIRPMPEPYTPRGMLSEMGGSVGVGAGFNDSDSKAGFVASFLDFLKTGKRPPGLDISPGMEHDNGDTSPCKPGGLRPLSPAPPPPPLALGSCPSPKRLEDELKRNLETLPSFSSDEEDSVGKNQDLQKSISSAISALYDTPQLTASLQPPLPPPPQPQPQSTQAPLTPTLPPPALKSLPDVPPAPATPEAPSAPPSPASSSSSPSHSPLPPLSLPSPPAPPETSPPALAPAPTAQKESPTPSPESPASPEERPPPKITSLHLAQKQEDAAIVGESEEDESESGGEGIFRERDEFVVRVEDIRTLKLALQTGREPPPIWRVQKALLQKFSPEIKDGQRQFCATSNYLGYFGDAKRRYQRIYVKFLENVNKKDYVRVCSRRPWRRTTPLRYKKKVEKRPADRGRVKEERKPVERKEKTERPPKSKMAKVKAEPPPKKRKKWLKEVASSSDSDSSEDAASENEMPVKGGVNNRAMREMFRSYVEMLVSTALDPDMIQALEDTDDELYLPPMRKIDSILSEQKRRLLRRVNMGSQHQVSAVLHAYPQVIVDPLDTGVVRMRLSGDAYNRKTLNRVKKTLPKPQSYRIYSIYHSLHHYKYHTFLQCKKETNTIEQAAEDPGQEEVVQQCMANQSWLDTLFTSFIELLTLSTKA